MIRLVTPEPAGARSLRHEYAAVEAAQRELQDGARRRIEPLRVVDRHEHRRERAQRADHAAGDRAHVGCGRARLAALERDLERTPLGRGEVGQRHVGEQVGERGERELRLRRRRPAAQHAGARVEQRGLEQRRLAEAGLTLEHDHPRGAQRAQFGLASDHRRDRIAGVLARISSYPPPQVEGPPQLSAGRHSRTLAPPPPDPSEGPMTTTFAASSRGRFCLPRAAAS